MRQSPFHYWYDLTEEEKSELDYIDTEDKQTDFTGFRYKGNVYSLEEFTRVETISTHFNAAGYQWDGYSSDSYFSGILVKYPSDDYGLDTDNIIVGTYFC